MASDETRDSASLKDAWREHNLSQLLYFRSLSLREKLAAVEGMADVVRLLEQMRARDGFRTGAPTTGETQAERALGGEEPAGA